ncbi:MAG: exodeoxyribonuclease V subunit alpha [Desulfuromonadales bacterium]|nr:exodeoxyribonuclease V subunit alpha [Desulfuromonadales bacterium]
MDILQLSTLDTSFADFIVRTESRPCEGLWLAAALVSSVTCRGHVCLELSSVADHGIMPFKPGDEPLDLPPADRWQELLAGCDAVGRPGDYTPLVLDAQGRLYLHRSWDAERRVAEGILARSASLSGDPVGLTAGLDRYFPPVGAEEDLQRSAAQAALSRQFTVISGGPGTGKTTTVARILALLIEQAGGEPLRIQLAAPTGKAAMRLRQSLTQAAERLPLPDSVRAALPREVATIHRLLGVVPGQSGFRHDRDNPLPCDVLVVDEASMIDLPLMARLLDAVPGDARVILLGDRDQLASVEAGAVLSDICAGGSVTAAPADRPAIVHLTKSYRFTDESGIGRLSRLINAGDGEGALELLGSGLCSDVCWRPLPQSTAFADSLMATVVEGYAAYAHAADPVAALEALDRFRVLAPHREGRHGVVSLNRLIESALSRVQSTFSAANIQRPVMITANSYELELFNGDTGIMTGVGPEEGPAVYFPAPESAGVRRISALRLPPHEPAFALTVHKTQGSEFDTVLLIMPDKMSEVLSRELLYTAVTRARKRIEIWGNEEVFRRAVERRIERSSGLRDRLWQGGTV